MTRWCGWTAWGLLLLWVHVDQIPSLDPIKSEVKGHRNQGYLGETGNQEGAI